MGGIRLPRSLRAGLLGCACLLLAGSLSPATRAQDLPALTPGTAPASTVLEYEDAPPGGDFTLQSAQGPVSLQDFRGQVVMLYFGYTRCPDVCPTSLSVLRGALDALSDEEVRNVRGIFISVDPQRDSPEILAEYAAFFHDAMIGATADEATIAEIARQYGAKYYAVELQGSAMGYAVNHSSALYLVDRQGELRFVFPHQAPYTVITEAIHFVLAE